MSDEQKNEQLSNFVSQFLAGGAELGMSLLPLVGLYAEAKTHDEWKELGVKEWIKTDPRAAPLLARALEQVKSHLPDDARKAIIVALGGIPV